MLAPAATLAVRHSRVREALDEIGLDALVVTKLPNVFYLTDLAASAALVVVTPAQLYLVSDFRYSAAIARLLAGTDAPPGVAFELVTASYDEALHAVLRKVTPARVGFEAAHVSVRQDQGWVDRFGPGSDAGVELVPTDGVIERRRMIKDPFEIGVLREAAGRLSEVARGVLSAMDHVGRAEREIAAEIDRRLLRAGFDRPAFDTIVATGANAALPHAHPTDRRVEPGDLLLFDFGGVLHGYCVDLTRTVATGPVTAEQQRIYRAVRDAQAAGIAAVAPGVESATVDAAARDLLAARGLGEAFGHGTGHGLGLEVHEDPRIAQARPGSPAPVVLAEGMVCTVEPGAYLPDYGGIRLEDDVLVTSGGCEVLTSVPFDERLA